MARVLFLLSVLPFLLGILVVDEPEPYVASDRDVLLSWNTATGQFLDGLDDPFLRVVFLDGYGLLENTCEEDIRTAMDLRDLIVTLHESLVDLGGRSREIMRTARAHIEMGQASPEAREQLVSALRVLEERVRLEEERHVIMGVRLGRAYGAWYHSDAWCQSDHEALAWLQSRRQGLRHAILSTIDAIGRVRHELNLPDQSSFYMRLLRSS